MNYQLVLQWPSFTIDYDAMVEIEDTLLKKLNSQADIDGHDIGLGESNIFIHTDNPSGTFAKVKTILCTTSSWKDIRVAYRDISSNRYTILWPKDLHEFNVR